MSTVFIAYDADNAGRLIGNARLHDEPEELARIANSIDQGNDIFKSWAVDHGGRSISAGGDEGILEVPATALNDLASIKEKYENALNLTVSIGIGMKMSDAFKALLASKLRGKNRTTMYDEDVEKEIAESENSDKDEKKKITQEYLSKAATIHHTGNAGPKNRMQEADSNPEIQQQETLADMPDVPEDNIDYEQEFRNIASEAEKKEHAKKARNSVDLKALKSKVASSLEALHKQLPILQKIKQASPDTYLYWVLYRV